MPRTSGLARGFWAALCTLLLTTGTASAQYVWSTTTTNTAWLTTGNWTGGPAGTFPGFSANPGIGNGGIVDIATIGNRNFTGSIGIDFSAAGANGQLTLGAIQFNAAAAGDLTIQSSTGGGTLTLRSEEVNLIPDVMLMNNSGGAANLTIASTNGLGLALGQNNGRFVMSAGRTITINTIISDGGLSFGFTAQGGGTLVLNAANTYGGSTTVTGNTLLQTNSGTGLGDAVGNTSVASGSSLEFTAGVTTAEQLTLNGTGVGGLGALRKTGANTTTITGAVTLGSATLIGSNTSGGTLTISGAIGGAGQNLTVDGVGNTTLSGIIGTGAGTITKNGAGTLTLSGANTYTGATTVNAGVLAVSNATGLGTVAGATTVADLSALQVSGTVTIAEAITINGLGVSNGGSLRKTGANVTTLTGAITLGLDSRINSDAGTLTIGAGGITGVNTNLTLGGAGNTTISGIIATGTGNLVKDGNGFVILSGANTHTGTTTIVAGAAGTGVLQFDSLGSIGGTGPGVREVTVPASSTVAAGFAIEQAFLDRLVQPSAGVIALAIGSGNNLDLTGFGTARLGSVSSATSLLSGTITPASSATYLLGGGGGTLEISSVLADIAGVTNLDVGTNGTARGRIILSGANTFTGTTTVSDGMVLQYTTAASMGGGLITVTSPSSVTAGYAIDQLFIDKITTGSTGAAALGVDSANNLSFTAHTALRLGATGTATYTGTLTPNGTTYRIGGGTGTLNFNSALVDVGGVTVVDVGVATVPGTVVLNGANTFTGGITINGGVLQPGTTTALNNNVVSFSNGSTGTLRLNGINTTIAGLTTLGTTGTIENGNATAAALTVNTSLSQTFAGNINNGTAGVLSLVKNGTGTFTLSGAASGYTGTTTISGGVLAITGGNGLGSNAGNTTVASGAALQVNGAFTSSEPITLNGTGIANDAALRKLGANTTTLSGVITLGASGIRINSDAGTLVLSNAAFGPAANNFTIGGAGATTISSVITGTGTITKDGAGLLTVSGTNTATFSGPVTITGGVLAYASLNNLGTNAGSGAVTIDGGTLRHTNTGSGGTFLSANRGIVIGSNGGTIDFTTAADANSTIYAGTITGTGTLTKVGNGEFRYQGPGLPNTTFTKLVVNQGLYRLGFATPTQDERGFGAVPGSPLADAITLNGGSIGTSFNVVLHANRGITLGASGGSFNNSAGAMTIPGIISGSGALNKNSTGTLTLSGANTNTGATNISAGTLAAGAADSLSPSSAVVLSNVAGATLNLADFSQTVASLAGGGTTGGNVTLGSATLTTGGNNSSTAFAGVISGTGGLAKAGTGVFTLGGVNTYGGATAINAGTLQAGVAGALPATTNVTIANVAGATLDLNNFNHSIQSLSGGGATGGAVTLGSATLTTGGGNTSTTFGGIISGTGGLSKAGTGTFTLTGANAYTGATTVASGTLAVGTGGSLASGSAVAVNAGAVLAGTGTVNGPVTVATDGIIRGDVPGGVGALTVANNVTLANNGILRTEVSRTGVGTADEGQLVITGAGVLNLAPTAGEKFSIDIVNNLTNPLVAGETYTLTLATVASGTINVNGSSFTGTIDPSNYTLWPGMTTANGVSLVSSGGNLTLTFSPVPEPATVLGLAAGALGLGGFIRRRLRNVK